MTGEIKRKGILFVMIGPSGSGKSTICGALVREFPNDLRYSISVTSRPPRPGEIDGVSYHFVSRQEFIEMRERGEFFEWEETHGNLYGTLRASLENGINAGHDLLFQIDIRGALTMKSNFPNNTVAVFLVPPSFEVLRERLVGRGGVDQSELERRLYTARQEYDALKALHIDAAKGDGDRRDASKIDYLVVNNDIDQTYAAMRGIVLAERARFSRLHLGDIARICVVDEGIK